VNDLKIHKFKILISSIFVVLIAVTGYSFYQNIQLKRELARKTQEPISEKIITPSVEESPEDLITRCGDFPEKVFLKAHEGGHWAVLNGPYWAPDCRHVAWSIWMSGTAWLGDTQEGNIVRKLDPVEGIYLFTERTKLITKIYQPKELDETPIVEEWKDRYTLIFTAQKGVPFTYDPFSQKTERFNP